MTSNHETAGTIVVVGSMNADLTVHTSRLPAAGETVIGGGVSRRPGGKGSNQAVAAALLGAAVHLIAAVGDDDNGTYLIGQAAEAGVATDMIRIEPGTATGTALVTVDDSAENVIVVSPGANSCLRPVAIQQSLRSLGRATVLSLSLEVPTETAYAAARAAAALGAKTLLNLSPYSPDAATILPMIDVVVLNELEALQAVGLAQLPAERPWEVVGALLGEKGPRNAVITLGAAGAIVMENLQAWPIKPAHIAATKVRPVDTTGCGDAFAGALAVELANGRDLIPAAILASTAAAYAATGHGAQNSYPNRSRLQDWLKAKDTF
ncbi:ribokinase [Arthrobacter sp. MMS24-S77]